MMITEVALITISCVLFVQMGLSEAIQNVLHLKLQIASCPKCLTWWTSLIYSVICGYGLLESVAASFIASYAAYWIALIYDALAVLYNNAYEQITKESDTPKAPAEADSAADIQTGGAEVS